MDTDCLCDFSPDLKETPGKGDHKEKEIEKETENKNQKVIPPEIEMLKDAMPTWGPDSCSRQSEWYEKPEQENQEEAATSIPSTVKSLGESWVPQPFEWIENPDGTYTKQLRGKYKVQYFDKSGCALPMYIEDLVWNLYQDKVESKAAIHKFYNDKIWDEQYFQNLLAQVYHHPLFEDFEKFTISFYELSEGEWWFGDENGDQLEDMVDFTHYLLSDYRVRYSDAWDGVPPDYVPERPAAGPMEAEAEKEGGAKNDSSGKNMENLKELEKLGVKDDVDEAPAVAPTPTAPAKRVRSKQPPASAEDLTNGKENEANWGVTWSPLTRKGFVDFIGYCSGHVPHVLENDQQQLLQCSIATTSNNLHVQKSARPIKLHPIKPGETTYLLNQFFRFQVESPEPKDPKDMNLSELIAYTKGIDFESQVDLPKETPMYVRATIAAIGSMWVSYLTDIASEVRQWLCKQCLDISSVSKFYPANAIKTQYIV